MKKTLAWIPVLTLILAGCDQRDDVFSGYYPGTMPDGWGDSGTSVEGGGVFEQTFVRIDQKMPFPCLAVAKAPCIAIVPRGVHIGLSSGSEARFFRRFLHGAFLSFYGGGTGPPPWLFQHFKASAKARKFSVGMQ